MPSFILRKSFGSSTDNGRTEDVEPILLGEDFRRREKRMVLMLRMEEEGEEARVWGSVVVVVVVDEEVEAELVELVE